MEFECTCGAKQTLLKDGDSGWYILMPCPCMGVERYLMGPVRVKLTSLDDARLGSRWDMDEYGNARSPMWHLEE